MNLNTFKEGSKVSGKGRKSDLFNFVTLCHSHPQNLQIRFNANMLALAAQHVLMRQ